MDGPHTIRTHISSTTFKEIVTKKVEKFLILIQNIFLPFSYKILLLLYQQVLV